MSRRRPLRVAGEENEVDMGPDGSVIQQSDAPEAVPCVAGGPLNPLSWLAMPWHLAMVVFYCLLLQHGASIMADEKFNRVADPGGKIPPFGGRLKFLTHINEWVQLGFFAIQLLADLSPGPFKKRLQRLADIVFTTIAFPLATFITVSFWGLYALDRKLIYPEVFDEIVPQYMNHFWHTTILLWVLCEVYLVHHHFPSTAWAAASVFVYGSAYNVWVVYIYISTEWWCYPFMNHLPLWGMAVFFASGMFLCLGLYLVGKWVAKVRWGVTTYLEGY